MTIKTKDTFKMALIKKDTSVNTSPAPVFEADPEVNAAANSTSPAEVVQVVQSVVSAPAPALVKPMQAAVAQASTRIVNLFAHLQDAMPVDYDTLPKIELKASGFTLEMDGVKVSFGDTLVFEVMSYQASFVVSPGVSGAEASALVKYSDDGKFTKDGRSCTEYLNELLQDYPNASIKERCVVVFDLVGAPNAAKDVSEYFESRPFQIDLPPTSRKNFHSYFTVANFLVTKGRLPKDRVQFVKARVSEKRGLVKGAKTDWAEAAFSAADA